MWYHGTNQNIKKFKISGDIQGLNTASSSCNDLIYFTKDTRLANTYADGAANKLYPEDHNGHVKKLDDWQLEYNRLLDKGFYNEADQLLEKIESYESMLSETVSGHCIYAVNLLPEKFKVFDFEGSQWGGDKTDKIINLARTKGLDAIFVCNVIDKISMLSNEGSEKPTILAVVLNENCIEMSFVRNENSITPEKVESINYKLTSESNQHMSM